MLVTPEGTAVLNLSTAKALENAATILERLRPGTPLHESVAGEVNAWQRKLDLELLERWRQAHDLHMTYRRLAADYDAELLELAPEYQASVKREQARYDAEHAEEGC